MQTKKKKEKCKNAESLVSGIIKESGGTLSIWKVGKVSHTDLDDLFKCLSLLGRPCYVIFMSKQSLHATFT